MSQYFCQACTFEPGSDTNIITLGPRFDSLDDAEAEAAKYPSHVVWIGIYRDNHGLAQHLADVQLDRGRLGIPSREKPHG